MLVDGWSISSADLDSNRSDGKRRAAVRAMEFPGVDHMLEGKLEEFLATLSSTVDKALVRGVDPVSYTHLTLPTICSV
eukprot:3669355-Prorocentrum_lima.AAC.1